MLSDEEKKAYDNLIMLKYFTMEKEDKQVIDTILNLIEKQSKEIEELKLKNEALGDIALYNQQNSVSKDKIKAKIEELKQKKYILSSRESEIEILKSLLEKE